MEMELIIETKNLQTNLVTNTINDNLVNAEQLYNWANSNQELKILEIETPFENFTLNDIKIKNRMREDEIFLKNSEMLKNIRRGNCIATYNKINENGLNVENAQNNGKNYIIIRKGLIKFFDYLKIYKPKLKNVEKIVLDPLKQFFTNNATNKNNKEALIVYITEKANGENAQIAYEEINQAWVVASKNVTIVVRNKEDIKWYLRDTQKCQKFQYCSEFAYLWFDILESKIKSQNKLEDFINSIKGHTLIAENVGDPYHQHIKLYKEKDLVFYGMVKNDSYEITESVSKSYDILFNKFRLNFVSLTKSEVFYTYEDFKSYMDATYLEILQKDVEDGGEGSVAYFTKVTFNNENEIIKESVISMAKLKTFEYRFLRKLREKLRTAQSNPKKRDINQTLIKIENECNDILSEDGDKLDLTEWLKFASFVLNFVEQKIGDCDFTECYADFIYEIKELYLNKNLVINDEIKNKLCLKFLKQTDNKIEQKIEDKIDINNTNVEMEESNVDNGLIDDKTYFNNLKNLTKNTLKKGNLYFILNAVLVGGGKSTFYNTLEKVINSEEFSDKINLMYLSSDKYKNSFIKEHMEQNPDDNFDIAYHKFSKIVNKEKFNNELLRIIESDFNNEKINLFFVDKNFPREEDINNFFKDMMAFDKKCRYEIFVFYPYTKKPFDFNNIQYPFSLNNFIQCYYRIKNRTHESLSFDLNPNAHHILLGFFAQYHKKNFRTDNKQILLYPLTFADEKKIIFSYSLKFAFYTMLKKVGGKGFNAIHMESCKKEVDNFFNILENECPMEKFDDTRARMEKEIRDFMNAKVYGKLEETYE